jgi:arsenite methyltransferase
MGVGEIYMRSGRAERAAPGLDRGRLRAAIEDAFTDLALHPRRGFHFISGPPLADRLGYSNELLVGVPAEALASFAGVGNPFRFGPLEDGARVVDVGCGAGTDGLIAGRLVGPRGSVIGVDMTTAMVERAHQCALAAKASNVRIEWGHAESLPVPDDWADVVITNGVVSLTPDKRDTFREIARVLRPGGELRVSDVVTQWRLPAYVTQSIHLWTDCIGGATWIEDYPLLLAEAGFVDIDIVEIFDVFAGTTIEKNSCMFEARGANIRARLPG